MKVKIILILAILAMAISVEAATLNLRATWTANTEPDMKDYQLYRTDGTRALIGTIVHPEATYNFSVNVPDGSAGTLTFVLRARDTNNNESADSVTASFPFNIDATPPAAPALLNISRQ